MNGLAPNMSTRDFNNSGSLLTNRMFYPDHPMVPMRSGTENMQTFKIDRINHPKCRLTNDLYTIVKEEVITRRKDFYVNFFAKIGDLDLGFSTCHPGWIDLVIVNEVIVKDSKNFNARECGLATVLTELCLIDPELNYLFDTPIKPHRAPKPNRAMTKLSDYPKPFDDVQTYCNALMGMLMGVEPKKGAHAYFSAALRAGYRRMIVFDGTTFHYFWVTDAQQRYVNEGQDSGTIGLIDGCCCEACGQTAPCDTWGKDWYFCKDI